LLHRLLSNLCEHASVLITTDLDFTEWSSLCGDPKITKALLDRLHRHCRIVATGSESIRFKRSTTGAAKRSSARDQAHRSARTAASVDCQ
jgi:DNA replication protein DnaC